MTETTDSEPARQRETSTTSTSPSLERPMPRGRSTRHVVTLFALTILSMVVIAAILNQIPAEQAFSAELTASEVQISFANASSLFPDTQVQRLSLDSLDRIEVPWGRSADGNIVEEYTLKRQVDIVSVGRKPGLKGFGVPAGTRVFLATEPSGLGVHLAIRRFGDDMQPRSPWPPIEIELRDETRVTSERSGRRTTNFGDARRLRAYPRILPDPEDESGEEKSRKDGWELTFTPNDQKYAMFYPALDVEALDFRITEDQIDPRVRGRVDETSIRGGTVQVYGIEDGEHTIHFGSDLVMEDVSDLRLEEVHLTPDGLSVRFLGRSSALFLEHRGEVDRISPTWLDLAHRTDWGKLLFAALLAMIIVFLEYYLDPTD